MKTSDTNREHALDNIERKIAALHKIAATINPDLGISEYHPKTVRQFNLWDMKRNSEVFQNEFPGIRRNANSTLVKYTHLLAEIKTTITEIQAKSKSKSITRQSKAQETLKAQAEYISALEEYTALQKSQLIKLHETMTEENSRLLRIIDHLKKQAQAI